MGLVSRLADNVVSALATVLDTRLASWEGKPLSPPRYEAYEAYLTGLNTYLRDEWGMAAEF